MAPRLINSILTSTIINNLVKKSHKQTEYCHHLCGMCTFTIKEYTYKLTDGYLLQLLFD